jgi:hypothetical protein
MQAMLFVVQCPIRGGEEDWAAISRLEPVRESRSEPSSAQKCSYWRLTCCGGARKWNGGCDELRIACVQQVLVVDVPEDEASRTDLPSRKGARHPRP